MPKFWYALLRQEVRVDGVMVRQVDTRVFHLLGSDYVLRQFAWKDADYNTLIEVHTHTHTHTHTQTHTHASRTDGL